MYPVALRLHFKNSSCSRFFGSKRLLLGVIISSGVTSLNGARPLNSNGAPTKYKFFTVSKKKGRHFFSVL